MGGNRGRLAAAALLLVMCAMLAGCGTPSTSSTAPIPKQVVFKDGVTRHHLHSPADFIVKVTGKTTYAYQDKEIPVGQLMKQMLEEKLDKSGKFTANKSRGAANQYILGIDIIQYRPLQIPSILCDVGVYSIDNSNYQELLIDKKLFKFHSSYIKKPFHAINHAQAFFAPFLYLDEAISARDQWRTIMEICVEDIVNKLNAVFP